MFDNVLLNIGSTVQANIIRHVADFCTKTGGRLTTLKVFEPPTKSVLGYFKDHGKDLQAMLSREHEESLAAALAEAGLDRSAVNPEVRWGTDFIETIRMVQTTRQDLVVCASKDGDKYPDATAMHLLRKCPCPVWVHRSQLCAGDIRILAAVGASEASEANKELDAHIMGIAAEMHRALGGDLHVLHCWKGSYESTVHSSPFFSPDEARNYMAEIEQKSEKYFSDITSAVTLPQGAVTAFEHGDPATLIPAYATRNNMTIVVMGSVARTGIPGLLIGNTAEKIINQLGCSILTVKPKGFVSPVK